MTGEAYRELERRFRRIGALRDAEAMLHWDLATMMPAGGAEARGDQLATIKALRHGLLTASEMHDWLAEAETDPALDSWGRANVREMKRQWAHATALSEAQVEALSRATTACEAAWRAPRPMPTIRPYCRHSGDFWRWFARRRQRRRDRLGLSPYD